MLFSQEGVSLACHGSMALLSPWWKLSPMERCPLQFQWRAHERQRARALPQKGSPPPLLSFQAVQLGQFPLPNGKMSLMDGDLWFASKLRNSGSSPWGELKQRWATVTIIHLRSLQSPTIRRVTRSQDLAGLMGCRRLPRRVDHRRSCSARQLPATVLSHRSAVLDAWRWMEGAQPPGSV